MKTEQIFELVKKELESAKTKWPYYYADIIHASALINEEAGETIQAALDCTYDNGSLEDVKKEAIQTAAMCFRLLENFEDLCVSPDWMPPEDSQVREKNDTNEQITIFEKLCE